MTQYDLNIKNIENLSYYNFMVYLGLQSFGLGGLKASKELAHLCGIKKKMRVLFAGCGTGISALLIAKKFDCKVVGIDIADLMIKKAKENAIKENLTDRAEFFNADVYHLPFEDNSFDVVIFEYIAQFLRNDAFKECHRVLKKNGIIGVYESYRFKETPNKIKERIQHVEQLFTEMTCYPFYIRDPDEWVNLLRENSFKDIKFKLHEAHKMKFKNIVKYSGGMNAYRKILENYTKYAMESDRIREIALKQKEAETILSEKSTARYIGYIICSAKKLIIDN